MRLIEGMDMETYLWLWAFVPLVLEMDPTEMLLAEGTVTAALDTRPSTARPVAPP
jgi:hypothetical protein